MQIIGLKSIRVLCTNIIVFLIAFQYVVLNVKGENYSQKKVLNNMPVKEDLETYLAALEKIINFSFRHKEFVDMNFEFGLLLINVNLRNILNLKENSLPDKTVLRLKRLLLKNDLISQFFTIMVKRDASNDEENDRYKKISTLFLNATVWEIDQFNIDLLNKTKLYSTHDLKRSYSNWKDYLRKVNDVFNTMGPKISDKCMELLAMNPISHHQHVCRIPYFCIDMVNNGSEYGYGLSHRLLYLALARYARGCSIFGEKEDKDLADKLCIKMYAEVDYIAMNEYKIPDLIMEQMALCSFLGHAQFLQRSWVHDLLQFQTPYGCYGENRFQHETPISVHVTKRPWKISNMDQNVMAGICNTHVSAVAAAVLASSVRYILETFY